MQWMLSQQGLGLRGISNPMAGLWQDQILISKQNTIWYNNPMKTLAEIERAAEQLPGAEQAELLYFLVQRLDEANLPLPEPREFSSEQLQSWMDEDEADLRRFKSGT